jgi:hypothetical protein
MSKARRKKNVKLRGIYSFGLVKSIIFAQMEAQIKLDAAILEEIRKVNLDMSKLQMAIGAIEVDKHNMLSQMDRLRVKFLEIDAKISEMYGADSKVDLSTGFVTKKKN